jgi:hypothetical protein
MDEIEEALRDGLRDAVSGRPPIQPIELDEVVARAGLATRQRRPIGRWVGLAAAVTIAAGLGLWALQTSARMPIEPAGSPTVGTQVHTLRVHNSTDAVYRRAALQLADGRSLALGDVPAGGTVVVPLDVTPTPAPSVVVETSGAAAGLHVVYSGDCSSSSGILVAILGDAEDTSVQIVAPSELSTPSPAAASGSTPGCTITIADDRPSPRGTHS